MSILFCVGKPVLFKFEFVRGSFIRFGLLWFGFWIFFFDLEVFFSDVKKIVDAQPRQL